ncbi:MAG: carbon monoxide dehydrogenase [Actinobacteria bacterium]|nr:MAG: carbon monoxide dehydrogenase [Actinomycetota bacterium]
MLIENEFTVKAPLDRVWTYMLDVANLAPCAPGAELTEVVDDRTWKGKLNVKVGPISMSFAGTVVLQERDDQSHRAVLKAEGREQRGRGAATAVVTSRMEPVEDGTRINIQTDLTITGAAAQYGRGMIGDISQRMTGDFARCLGERLSAPPAGSDPAAVASSGPVGSAPAAAAQPVKGIRLAVWALWRAVVRFFRRLFGRSS